MSDEPPSEPPLSSVVRVQHAQNLDLEQFNQQISTLVRDTNVAITNAVQESAQNTEAFVRDVKTSVDESLRDIDTSLAAIEDLKEFRIKTRKSS